jgi:hypothetical protein
MKRLEDKAELYGTPPYITKALLKREFLPGLISEPAAGLGDIVTVVEECGYTDLHASDLHDWGFRPCRIENFLTSTFTVDTIITNSPFSLKAKFLDQAKRQARRKIAMLLPVDFEYTRTFTEHHLHDAAFPWKALYAFPQGIGWLRRTDRSGRRKAGWFVFERGYQGPVIRETILFRPNK